MGEVRLKRGATDGYFSDLIRERVNWICERCGKDFSEDRQKLHASHFIGRGNKNVRWNLDNAAALCGGMAPWGLYGCHKEFTEDALAHYEFFRKRLGTRKLNKLKRESHEFFKGKDEMEIRKSLKEELRKLQESKKGFIVGARAK
jgi:hypothetical protein